MNLKIALWVITYRAYFRSLGSYNNMTTVAALPYLDF